MASQESHVLDNIDSPSQEMNIVPSTPPSSDLMNWSPLNSRSGEKLLSEELSRKQSELERQIRNEEKYNTKVFT